MRCEKIKITYTIPVKINEPDLHGVIYTEEAVINACKNACNAPIIQFDSEGNEIVIGVATDVKYSDGYIWVEGYSWCGGTNDRFCEIDYKTVKSYVIKSIGLCK